MTTIQRSYAGVASQVTIASAARPGKRHNEDLVGVLGPHVWLLDGTSPRGRSCCDRDGAWYVQRLGSALAATLGADSDDLQDALEAALAAVAQEHAAQCDDPGQVAGPSATVLIVRHQGSQLDFLILGDSALLLETDDGVSHHSDKRLAGVAPEVRRQIKQQLGAGHGYDSDAHRELVEDLVAAEQAVRNTDDGYWIASFDPQAAHHSLTGSRSIGDKPGQVRRAALVSDGLERAVTLLGLCASWDELLQALITNGPNACIEQVREAEAADPTGQQHPRTAASDDASAVLLEFV
jgi:serine/threonine protein phosphatase PrpC